jgi:hypothetical protein
VQREGRQNKAFCFGSHCLAAREAGILPCLAINLVAFSFFPLQVVAFRKFI